MKSIYSTRYILFIRVVFLYKFWNIFAGERAGLARLGRLGSAPKDFEVLSPAGAPGLRPQGF